MKGYGLFVVTVLTLGITGAVLSQAAPVKHSALARAGECRSAVKYADPLQSSQAQRWRRGEPRHWRDLLLHQ